ncbi:MAG: hypothetical protein G3M78_06600 [Candidatus Nitrohelix vancouverensis]|uniref:HEAT repeat domain-containing protein n=1 Tax=Candidatus Nitrohelix vancouverensis TaxID=2705534 RepID=A0A7T0G386_9BACT|nr:MAG: hypothetical protein G3M78_06600 [Candidatus Nitrohelix vancouverensis]
MRFYSLVIGFLAAALVIGGMLWLFGKDAPGNAPSRPDVPASKKWIPPEGDAESLADKYTVEELLQRWNRWPENPKKESLHLTYAKALALYGTAAYPALDSLGKKVKHENPNLRRAVMGELMGIGEDGVSYLVDALQRWPETPGANDVDTHIRWDAAEYLAKAAESQVDIYEAIPALRETLLNGKAYVFTRNYAAQALMNNGSDEALSALEEAKTWFYDQQGGIGVEETRILRNINSYLSSRK